MCEVAPESTIQSPVVVEDDVPTSALFSAAIRAEQSHIGEP